MAGTPPGGVGSELRCNKRKGVGSRFVAFWLPQLQGINVLAES